jgi:hypothetical protein
MLHFRTPMGFGTSPAARLWARVPILSRSLANWTRSPDESALGFNADAVVHSTSNPLLAAEVALGRLD